MTKHWLTGAVVLATAAAVQAAGEANVKGSVKLLTLDPGHFHASLVQKLMYEQVDPAVRVYSPGGADLAEHLKRIDGFNARAENPTHWAEKVYTGADFFEKMVAEKAGNVVVISGNNAKKARYVLGSVDAGFNVLADKPMAVVPEDLELLRKAFADAKDKGVLLYDIMTERSEITTVLQKELSHMPEVFGTLQPGTTERPAVTKESVHHYCKTVAGAALKRPAWFFDTAQQGEGIVDVTTHLVDLIQWECFPEVTLDGERDVKMLTARRWTTKITPAQFKKVTGLESYPEYLKKDTDGEGALNVYANGEMNYTLKGVHAKVSVAWNFEPPEGAGDTHYSMMRGTKADLVIRQGADQKYKPTLYVEPQPDAIGEAFDRTLAAAIAKVDATYPGVEVKKFANGWEVVIPEKYKIGHEAHFGQVTERFLRYLADGKLPAWEVPNMLSKYYTTMEAYKMSR